MKRIYTFTVHETYAGSRDGEIIVEIETDNISSDTYKEMMKEAEQEAYDNYTMNNVDWENERDHDSSETDYDIDFDSSYVLDDDGNEIRGDEDD